jgi:hypothetical protein
MLDQSSVHALVAGSLLVGMISAIGAAFNGGTSVTYFLLGVLCSTWVLAALTIAGKI